MFVYINTLLCIIMFLYLCICFSVCDIFDFILLNYFNMRISVLFADKLSHFSIVIYNINYFTSFIHCMPSVVSYVLVYYYYKPTDNNLKTSRKLHMCCDAIT